MIFLRRFLRFAFFGVLCFVSTFSIAQQRSVKIPFYQLLEELHNQHSVTFSYNNTLLDPLQVEQPKEDLTLEEVLRYIESLTPVRFEAVAENEYMVVPVRSQVEFVALDAETQQTIPALYFQVNDEPQKYLVAQKDKFVIADLFPTDSLTVESRFYTKMQLAVSDLISANSELLLTPATIELDEVSIVGYITRGVNSKLSDHSLEVNMNDLGLLAGETDGDVLQLLKSMPGIRTPSGKPGSLTIRGSTFSQNLVYFDDIPIYHQGHFFGTVSPFNPGIVDKVLVFRGTLPAQWGGRVGGLIDIRTSDKVPDSFAGGASVNTVFSGVQLKTPIIKNKLGLSISARSNYPFKTLPPKMQQFSDLNFQGSKISPNKLNDDNKLEDLNIGFNDINGKLTYNIAQNHSASISFIRIENDFNYRFHSIVRDNTETQNADLDNWGITAKWRGQLSERLGTSISITKSSLEIAERKHEVEKGDVRKSETAINILKDNRLVADVNYMVNNNANINLGYESRYQDVQFEEIHEVGPPAPPGRNTTAYTHTFYGNLNKNFGTKMITNIGLHTDYYQPLSEWYADPRLSVSYLATNSLSFKASGGRSHQFIKQSFSTDFEDFLVANQFWRLSTGNNPALEGYQGMAGASFDRQSWIIDLEFYAKKTNNVAKNFDRSTGLVPIGSLTTSGADLFVKKRWNKFEAWTSYSISKTTSDYGAEEIAYFDQTHAVDLMLIMDLNRWDCAISWNYMSGMPVILPDLSTENNPNPDAPTSIEVPYTGRFPAYHQLDLSVTYQLWPVDHKLKGVIGFSILNVYDRQNFINLFQKQVSADNLYRYAIGFSPNLQVSITF